MLYEIIHRYNKQILQESVLQDIRDRYREEMIDSLADDDTVTDTNPDGFINYIAKQDPTHEKMYADWMVMQYVFGNINGDDIPKLNGIIRRFHKSTNFLPKKLIRYYNTVDELTTALDTFKSADDLKFSQLSDNQRVNRIKKKGKEGGDVIVNGPDATIVKITNIPGACYYGTSTKWCTSTRTNQNQFDQYNKLGNMYVLIGKDGEKYQLQFSRNDYRDNVDSRVSLETLIKKYPSLLKAYKHDSILSSNPRQSYEYAKAANERFPEGEKVIASSSDIAFLYNRLITKLEQTSKEPELNDLI